MLLSACALVVLGACEDDPVANSADAEDVATVAILAGQDVVEASPAAVEPDTIVLQKGIDAEFALLWKDAQGDVVAIDEAEGFSFDVQSADESLVSFAPLPSADPWDGVLFANAAGLTTIRVRLLRDGDEVFGANLRVEIVGAGG